MKVPLYATAGVATSCVAFLFGYVVSLIDDYLGI